MRFSIVAERASLVPGETARLGLLFELDPGWHLYWRGRSDTGLPVSAKLRLPEGYEGGELLWPAPERKLGAAGILDHVHHDELLLILPLRVPDTALPGETASIGVDAEWVACEELCVFGGGSARITLPVTASAGAEANERIAARFAQTRRRLPASAAALGREVQLQWRDTRLAITAPEARRLEFYPAADCGELIDAARDAAADGPRLELRFEAGKAQEARARGVLAVIADTPHRTRYFTLDSRPETDPSPSP